MRKRNLSLTTASTIHEQGKKRAVIICFRPDQPELITVRASGLRTKYHITGDDLYSMCARKTADLEARAKRIERINKKKGVFA